MKKSLVLLAGVVMFGLSCNKSTSNEDESFQDEEITATKRSCSSDDVLQQQLIEDPTLGTRMNAIEEFTRRIIESPDQNRLVNGVIEIPVVFNVLYKTTAQNVSQAQLQSQIDVLNEDFAATNADYNLTSTYNSVKSGNIAVRFVLDAVVRKQTNTTSWSTNNAMKKSAKGIAPTSPTTKLNIWVCNMGGGILGYAQFPGGSSATDGVVLDDNATGRTGTAAAPFNKGRTATHEVGHWMNLRHIWGDATCGTDQVGDTPTHNTANYGCPASGHKSTCSGTPVEMTMNYMDYTDDACMYMFSLGQETRMLAVFAAGGPRNSFAQ
ncbi:MAG: zinc metalloprotease [Chitinophagaceae bacterium]|nr:zinc metalloprotease [Chitinophagaceae bacterium]MBP6476565.1 zinc metalloprotease [Chitinophagaceae bacterium]MBP7108288.1 zinc metalloprotease [Chitinophagaceae bacterium]MBP7315429.1 zinc metalloprotease [Chitinophagaceae bacterium]HQV53872.1 zinc metalloprotease [Chitinophagaceae bacterium]